MAFLTLVRPNVRHQNCSLRYFQLSVARAVKKEGKEKPPTLVGGRVPMLLKKPYKTWRYPVAGQVKFAAGYHDKDVVAFNASASNIHAEKLEGFIPDRASGITWTTLHDEVSAALPSLSDELLDLATIGATASLRLSLLETTEGKFIALCHCLPGDIHVELSSKVFTAVRCVKENLVRRDKQWIARFQYKWPDSRVGWIF